jgi:hypothetical protein
MTWTEWASRLQGQGARVVLEAPFHYGVGHLLQMLATPEKPLVWTELSPNDVDDTTSQGNKLAEAFNRTFGGNLLTYGLPVAYNLNVLKMLHGVIAPCTLALTEAQHAPEVAAMLLELASPALHVVLHFEQLPKHAGFPKNVLVIRKKDLELGLEDALELAEKRISKKTARALLAKTNCAYDPFLAELHQELQLPPHLMPGPAGPRLLPGYEVAVEMATLLGVLAKRKRWLEALELAAHHLPEQVPKVLEEAGHAYHEQGLHKRLFALLESLPEKIKIQENVLYWRLQAAYRLGREESLRAETERYLETNEAPELRALYAGVFAPTNRKEASRAYQAKKTPFTAMQLGRLTDTKESLSLLREAIQLAEQMGKPYEVIRNASVYGGKLMFRGYYQDAVKWLEWSLKEFERARIKDGQRRLLIYNDWTHAKILLGETVGLETLLKTNEAQLDGVYPDLAYIFAETIGDYYIATAQARKALEYYKNNSQRIPRRWLAANTVNVVRALLEVNDRAEAQHVAQNVFYLTRNESPAYRAEAELAYGMSLALGHPTLAQDYLQAARKSLRTYYVAYRIAQTALYLAFIEFKQGNKQKARSILRDPKNHVVGLPENGLRLLSGPESEFRPLWNLLKEDNVPLELCLLGESDVWYEGEAIKLHPQQLEILAVLASHKRPVTLGELLSDLHGDGGNKETLKSVLSRLRQKLPVISQHPYHLTVRYRADFLELLEHINQGQLPEAMNLYKGQLLKDSDAPYLRDKDQEISEALQQLALAKGEVETLLQLSEYFPDDLRLWEKAEETLQHSDPRAFLLKTRLHQVRESLLN